MRGILSRLLIRVAIVAASLAWAGFVFTQTIGDPQRGERVAAAVLADDDARAEVVAPITSTVMTTFVVPPDQRAVVAAEVERALSDPVGARSFIDPFAGSWARMLGEDDARPTDFDLAPLLDRFAATAPPGALDAFVIPDRLPVAGVPLPRTRLDWMADVRSVVEMAILPLALLAFGLFTMAFVIGERARVLRRFGVWAILAGSAWIVIPPFVVWLTRQWAPGADSVAAVAVDEAVAGLLPAAIALAGVGAVAFVLSFAVAPVGERAPTSEPVRAARPARTPESRTPEPRTPGPRPTPAPARRPIESTAEMPAVTARVAATAAPNERPASADAGDDLWDYYTSS